MKRVCVFDETFSPACFIYYTLASPAGNSVFLYVWALSCFRIRGLPRLCQQSFEWREYWGTGGTLAGKNGAARDWRGENREGKTFLFPLTQFPFSLALFPLCPHAPSENVALVRRTLWLRKKEFRARVRRHRLINYT